MDKLLPFKYKAIVSELKPCPLCESDKSDDMRKCKKCQLLFHPICVNASLPTRSVGEWKCPNCEEEFKIISNYGKILEENKKIKIVNDKLNQNQVDMIKIKDLESKVNLLSEQNKMMNDISVENEELKKMVEQLETENSVLEDEKNALNETKPNITGNSMEFLANTISNTLKENSANLTTFAEKFLVNQKQAETSNNSANNFKSNYLKEYVKDLPLFYGAPKDWPAFKKAFLETSKVGGFSQFEDMCRLSKALRGQARDLVDRLLGNSSNIKAVLKILERRFGDSRIIYNELKQKILHCKPAKSNNEDLIVLNTAIGNLIETMKSLNADSYLNDISLVEDIIRKLPEPLQDKWYDKLESEIGQEDSDDETEDYKNISLIRHVNTYSVNDIYKFMRSAVNCANYKAAPVQQSNFRQKVLYTNDKNFGNENKKNNFTKRWQSNEPSKYCFYCKSKDHFAFDCLKFTNLIVDERQKLVQEKKICQSCLKSSRHNTSICFKKKICGKNNCNEFHHPLLHAENSFVITAKSDTAQKP
jgi:hypothetical protein